jgi:hypothetical protein
MLCISADVLVAAPVRPLDPQTESASAGWCLEFDGVDDFVGVTRTAALEPGQITVELWARLDGPQDWNSRLLRKGEHDAYFITADQDLDQRMQLLVTRGTQYWVQAKDTQSHLAYNGTWHHFLGLYATDHAEFWVDGVQKSSVTHDLGALTHMPLTDLCIGAGLPVPLQNEYFRGRIDEVRIWDHPRSPAQIQASWNKTLPGNEPGLVAYWRFDEGSGQVAHDSTSYAHDGQLGVSPAAEPSDPQWRVSEAPIRSGSSDNWCLAFDGVDDLVHVLHTPSLEPGEITVELWARLNGPQGWNTRLLRKCGHWADGYYISADADFDQRMQLMVSKAPPLVQAKDPQPHTAYIGEWHHFAGVYAKDRAEFWVDGVQVAEVAHDLGLMSHLPLTDLYIGAGLPAPASEFFSGRIDEVRIWNYPRWPAEIQADWWRSLSGNEPGLVAYWRFDEGQGQEVRDSSPFGNHGELGLSAAAEASDPSWMVSDAPLGSATCGEVVYACAPAAPNSANPGGAVLEALGCASHKVNDLELIVTHLPPHQLSLFLYGPAGALLPAGNGWLCVGSPVTRLGPAFVSSAAGTVVRPVDLSQAPFNGGSGWITPGSTWHFQSWYRDSNAGGAKFNFSSAAAITFAP